MKFYPQSMCWRASICSTRPELDPLPLLSHRNLSVTATYEHTNSALSSTCLQSIGGSGESGEPGRSSPVAPGPTAPEDSGAGIASPGAALPDIPRPTPRTTRLRDKPPASSHDRGPAPSTSTLTAPSDTPLASCSSRTSASCKRVALLPSCATSPTPPALAALVTPAASALTPLAPLFLGVLPSVVVSLRGPWLGHLHL
jgi:hypothetical protein